MDRCINADELACQLEDENLQILTYKLFSIADFIKMLEDAPTADVQEVIHAHWIDTGKQDGNDNYEFMCSACEHIDSHSRQADVPHCWYCAAKMDGDINDK